MPKQGHSIHVDYKDLKHIMSSFILKTSDWLIEILETVWLVEMLSDNSMQLDLSVQLTLN